MGGESNILTTHLSGRFTTTLVHFNHGRPKRQQCFPDVCVFLSNDELSGFSTAASRNESTKYFSVPIADILGVHILRPRDNLADSVCEELDIDCCDDLESNNTHQNFEVPKPTKRHSSADLNASASAGLSCNGLFLHRRMLNHIFSQSLVSVYLALVTYSERSASGKPQKAVLIFKFDKYSDGILTNVHDAERWQKIITILARHAIEPTHAGTFLPHNALSLAASQHEIAIDPISVDHHKFGEFQKRFLIFINPSSGAGNSIKLFQREVVPVLREAVVQCRIVVTEFAQQAFRMIQCLDLQQCDAVVIVSGDGLIFEVLNGIMLRADADDVISSLPFAHIPGGSGNALACNVEHRATGLSPACTMTVTQCALMTVRCYSIPMDIYRIQLCDTSVLYGFLTVTFGLIADIDIDSEKLRFTGGTRFFLYSLYRYIRIKRYLACVSYLPAPENDAENNAAVNMPSINEPVPSNWVTLPFTNFHTIMACCLSYITSAANAAPGAELDDGLLHLMALRGDAPRSIVKSFLWGMENGNLEANCGKWLIRKAVTAVRIVPLCDNTHISVDGERVKFGPVQAQVLPRKARVIVHRPKSLASSSSYLQKNTSAEVVEPYSEAVV